MRVLSSKYLSIWIIETFPFNTPQPADGMHQFNVHRSSKDLRQLAHDMFYFRAIQNGALHPSKRRHPRSLLEVDLQVRAPTSQIRLRRPLLLIGEKIAKRVRQCVHASSQAEICLNKASHSACNSACLA